MNLLSYEQNATFFVFLISLVLPSLIPCTRNFPFYAFCFKALHPVDRVDDFFLHFLFFRSISSSHPFRSLFSTISFSYTHLTLLTLSPVSLSAFSRTLRHTDHLDIQVCITLLMQSCNTSICVTIDNRLDNRTGNHIVRS